MRSSYFTALGAETYVSLRSPSMYFVVLGPAVLTIVSLLLTRYSELRKIAQSTVLGQEPSSVIESTTAYGYFIDSLVTGLTVIVFLFVAYSAWSFSHDTSLGTIRHALIQRANRVTYVLAKLTLTHGLLVLSLLSVMGGSYIVAGAIWDYGPVVEDGYEIIGEAEILEELGLGLILAIMSLPAALAFGGMISVILRSPTRAIVTAVLLMGTFDIFKADLGRFSHYFFPTFLPSIADQSYLGNVARLSRGFSDVYIDDRVISLNLWVTIPEMVVLVLITLFIVKRVKL